MEIYGEEWAASYGRRADAAIPGREGLYRLCCASLLGLPHGARILVVGCGTGDDLLPLAKAHPSASFVGLEPADAMLQSCTERVAREGLEARVALRAEALEEHRPDAPYHAATAILVSQHIASDAGAGAFFARLAAFLVPGGRLYSADLHIGAGQDRERMLALWREQARMSGIEETLVEGMLERFRTEMRPRDEAALLGFLEGAGFVEILKPFSSLLYGAWSARRGA